MATILSILRIKPRRSSYAGAAGALALLACAFGCSSVVEVKFTVNSEPPGAYTTFQTLRPEQPDADWLYIGNTPLVTVREVNEGEIESAKSVTMKVMKQGYFDQTKVWSGKQFMEEIDTKGGIFWNPHMVPSN